MKTYVVRKHERTNPLSSKPSPNTVRVVFETYETVYDNVHHTNAFVNKIVQNNDQWQEIWVNETRVKWRIPDNDDLPF